ncbi:MAG: SEL1-like repeat protein [Myxococcales bacterium]|nr:SEL1-like repeat protein [Myxococcales bacterium]
MSRRVLAGAFALTILVAISLGGPSLLERLGYACLADKDSLACRVVLDLGLEGVAQERMQVDHGRQVSSNVARLRDRRAVDGLAPGCAAGDLDDCVVMAGLLGRYEDGHERSATLYGRICHRTTPGDFWNAETNGADWEQVACAALGDAYRTGQGVGQDRARARQLYADACANKSTKGCSDLAHMMFADDEDLDEVRRIAMTTCAEPPPEYGRGPACLLVACADPSDIDEALVSAVCDGGAGDKPSACISGFTLREDVQRRRCGHYRISVYDEYGP